MDKTISQMLVKLAGGIKEPLMCICGGSLILGDIVDIYGHYTLMEAKEKEFMTGEFGYVVINLNTSLVIKSMTAARARDLDIVLGNWEEFKMKQNDLL